VVVQEQAWEEWAAYRQAVAQLAAVQGRDAAVQECGQGHEPAVGRDAAGAQQ
jgi:hypothetical protein